MFKFQRPQNIPFPLVYGTFYSGNELGDKDADNKCRDEVIEYRIQEIPVELYEEAADFMVKHHLNGEIFAESLEFAKRPLAVQELRNSWLNVMKEKVSICCFANENGIDTLVAVNVLYICSKDDSKSNFIVSFSYFCLKILNFYVFSLKIKE
jgi:hypothetical protein